MNDIIEALDVLKSNGVDNTTIVAVAQNILDHDGFDDLDDKKSVVLVVHTSGSTDIEACKYDDCTFQADGAEYLVLDEDEMESRVEDCLENLLDDCIEGADGPYFNREAWKRDARMDGAGHILSGYDGSHDDYDDMNVFRTN